MLTILFGTDTKTRAKRLDELVSGFKKSGTEIRFYTDITFNTDELRATAGDTSLFGGTSAVIISGIGDRAELRDEAETILSELAESTHEFVLSENALLAGFLKKAKGAGAVVEEFKAPAKGKKEEVFNVFALTDAFSLRKRSLAWALYRRAISAGLEPRELHGKLFWAVKTMLLAEGSSSASEAGIHPFVYTKAKASAKNFAPKELEHIAVKLTEDFHQVLLEGRDAETAFEASILRVLEKPSSSAI